MPGKSHGQKEFGRLRSMRSQKSWTQLTGLVSNNINNSMKSLFSSLLKYSQTAIKNSGDSRVQLQGLKSNSFVKGSQGALAQSAMLTSIPWLPVTHEQVTGERNHMVGRGASQHSLTHAKGTCRFILAN